MKIRENLVVSATRIRKTRTHLGKFELGSQKVTPPLSHLNCPTIPTVKGRGVMGGVDQEDLQRIKGTKHQDEGGVGTNHREVLRHQAPKEA